MVEAQVNLLHTLKMPYARVVQKGNVGETYVYASQMYKNQTLVSRIPNNQENLSFPSPQTWLTGTASGHTQTWEYAKNNNWFVGVKPNPRVTSGIKWSTQIARMKFGESYSSNTQMSRLSQLVEATDANWRGQHLLRVEAAATPNYDKLLIAGIWNNYSGHFALYDLESINSKLSTYGTTPVPINLFDKEKIAFHIDDFFKGGSGDTYINSVQGYDIDDNWNICVTSQPFTTNDSEIQPKIVKIPWGSSSNNNGQAFYLNGIVDNNYFTELESIQITGTGKVYVTALYHDRSSADNYVVRESRIYQVFGIL
ncbi:helveticin J family class III bacteriocin [Lactobacillus helveticus]|nr:helveticin J family class III bacteriocin [Lactobacillus helveticus]